MTVGYRFPILIYRGLLSNIQNVPFPTRVQEVTTTKRTSILASLENYIGTHLFVLSLYLPKRTATVITPPGSISCETSITSLLR